VLHRTLWLHRSLGAESKLMGWNENGRATKNVVRHENEPVGSGSSAENK
jgi:hypothetical protein